MMSCKLTLSAIPDPCLSPLEQLRIRFSGTNYVGLVWDDFCLMPTERLPKGILHSRPNLQQNLAIGYGIRGKKTDTIRGDDLYT